jgi:NADPH:quinone reductase
MRRLSVALQASAWEAMFRDQNQLPNAVGRVLIGGAGGVGSLATQLLKAKTKAFVISTASRLDSRDWCLKMGADLVIDHTGNIFEQLKSANISDVDMVLSTAGAASNLPRMAEILRPFGHLCLVDMTPSLDTGALMQKSMSVHFEMVFSKVLHGYDLGSQAGILEAVVAMVRNRQLQPIATTRLDGLIPETMKAAHQMLETKRTIGKIVITTRFESGR